jgi:hypothetical protein
MWEAAFLGTLQNQLTEQFHDSEDVKQSNQEENLFCIEILLGVCTVCIMPRWASLFRGAAGYFIKDNKILKYYTWKL